MIALVRYNDTPVIDAEIIEVTDRLPIRHQIGVGQPLAETTISLPIAGFIAVGSMLAGFVVGVAVCDILERG